MAKISKELFLQSVKDGRTDVVVNMLTNDADNELIEAKDLMFGRTALHWAAGYDQVDTFGALISWNEPDLNVKDNAGLTPLHLAAMNGSNEIVKILLDEPTCDFDAKDNKNETALFKAIECTENVAAQLIMQHIFILALKSNPRLAENEALALPQLSGFYLENNTPIKTAFKHAQERLRLGLGPKKNT